VKNYFAVTMTEKDVNQITVLGLAHCGDAVFELLVRSWLCSHGSVKAGELHKKTVEFVSAPAQARRCEALLPLLTEQELAWFKRGRNAQVHGVPKNATREEYGKATGLECLFGALYLTGQTERANELFVLTMEEQYAL
jgi:ribonuclease-3 family protein